MAEKFVPFNKPAAAEPVAAFQFNQYQPSAITLTRSASLPRVEAAEVKSKLLSDLKNAVALALPAEVIGGILEALAHIPPAAPTNQSAAESPEGFHARNAAPAHPSPRLDKPNIALQKDGDKVTHITVECTCGEIIPLDCIY